MASDKSGRMRRPASANLDPRHDDAGNGDDSGSGPGRGRTRISRPEQPDNPLDRITAFETTARSAPGVPPIVPAESSEPEPPGPGSILLAPPEPEDIAEVEALPTASPVASSVVEAPPPPPPPAPVIEPTISAAELLDLGGRRTAAVPTALPVPEAVAPESSDREAAAARALEPLALLRPVHRPVVFRRARRPRVRRVTRVVRHVDPWSVFKVAFVFNLVVYVVCLTAGVLLWNVAYTTGTIDNVENFFEQFGWESFEFVGGEIYHNAWIAGLFVAVGLTGLAVLLATLFNLITDLVGGIRVTVLEEEVVAKPASARGGKTRELGLNLAQQVPVAPPSDPPTAAPATAVDRPA